jgi:hypothetical protein
MVSGGGESKLAGQRFSAAFDQEGHSLTSLPTVPATKTLTIQFQNGGALEAYRALSDASESPKSGHARQKVGRRPKGSWEPPVSSAGDVQPKF